MKCLNVTAVVFGDPASVKKWVDAEPRPRYPRHILHRLGNDARRPRPLDQLRKDFTTGGFKVMGEIGLQYEGLSPSDPSVDQYFALAEELYIPVAIRMGTGGSGRANIGFASGSAAPWATRSCSRTSSRATPNSASRSCTPATP